MCDIMDKKKTLLCPDCGLPVSESDDVCPHCGYDFVVERK
jgi:rubrerythrin